MKIASIVGARPQFIKLAPFAWEVHEYNKSDRNPKIKHLVIHTGQHYNFTMSGIFFKDLGLEEPDFHLGVGSGSHGEQTGQIIKKTEQVLLKENPDIAVVYGDTNSTLGATLAAVKLHIPIAHVEAGLRSHNKYMPEEINRIHTDHSSSLLFCPTETAVRNLQQEGFRNIGNKGELVPIDYDYNSYKADLLNPLVLNIGDVMYDVLNSALTVFSKRSRIMEDLKLINKEYAVLTLHRAENMNRLKIFEEIIDFTNEVSAGKIVIFPVHPRTKKILQTLKKRFTNNITMIEPISYFDMVWLVKNSIFVLTDSGGLQKEAYWLKVPCITIRDETEWVETLQSGWNVLYKEYKGSHSPLNKNTLLYGDGKAAERIVQSIVKTIPQKK